MDGLLFIPRQLELLFIALLLPNSLMAVMKFTYVFLSYIIHVFS